MAQWTKCISTPGNIRGIAIQATDLVQKMAETHAIEGIAAKGLGESVIAGLLIASFCKQDERVNLNIRGSGHYSQALVDAHPDGTVRGYVVERSLEGMTEPVEGESFGPWGEGLMSVMRAKADEIKQPYIGTVPLLTGHLAKDLTFYWVQSEQIPSAVGIVVELKENQVIAAGGFLIQALPGATPAEIKAIEEHICSLDSLSQCLTQNADPKILLAQIFQSTPFVVLEEKPLEFKCTCSWERVERALALVGPKELQAMLSEDDHAIVRCDFCNKEYKVGAEALQKMIDRE
jgi:molecular chaperone Hsp33